MFFATGRSMASSSPSPAQGRAAGSFFGGRPRSQAISHVVGRNLAVIVEAHRRLQRMAVLVDGADGALDFAVGPLAQTLLGIGRDVLGDAQSPRSVELQAAGAQQGWRKASGGRGSAT